MNSKTGKGFLIIMLKTDPKDMVGLGLIALSVIAIVIREYVKK